MRVPFAIAISIVAGFAAATPQNANAVPVAIAPLGTFSTPRPSVVGTIPGLAGHFIFISKLGISGDADAGSGDSSFRLYGGGLDVTWVAGQGVTAATYRLAPTPAAPGAPDSLGRGFSYVDVSHVAAAGSSVEIAWLAHSDFDGLYTFGVDALGTAYNDTSIRRSVRAWVQYEYVTTVPTPGTVALVLTGLLALGIARRWRYSVNGRPLPHRGF